MNCKPSGDLYTTRHDATRHFRTVVGAVLQAAHFATKQLPTPSPTPQHPQHLTAHSAHTHNIPTIATQPLKLLFSLYPTLTSPT